MSQPDLQWKDIPIEPFNTSYEISNYGDIKNKKTQKIKAFQISSTGYKSVKLDTKKKLSKYRLNNLNTTSLE